MIEVEVLDALAPDREWSRKEPDFGTHYYKVLDHGYLHVKRTWGSDEEIVETARMSTSKGFLGWEAGPCPLCNGRGAVNKVIRTAPHGGKAVAPATSCHDCDGKGKIPGDAKLLKYLYEAKHSTPFEFSGLTVEVQAPIMVFREWHRHRVPFGYSEMSARYVKMPNLHYVPSVARIIASAKKSKNKQASGGGVIRIPDFRADEREAALFIQQRIRDEQARIYKQYEELISFGVAKEVARLDTPVSRYSRMRATGNLRGWLGFLTLRMDPRAQFEIRQFAWCVADAIATAFPRTYELFFAGMTPTLDPKSVEDQKKLLSDALDVLNWASGGQAVQGWRDRVDPVRERLRKALGKAV